MKNSLVGGLAAAVAVMSIAMGMPAAASALKLEVVPGGTITAGAQGNTPVNQIAVADFDGDGSDDIAATTDASGIQVWLPAGDGTFAPAPGSGFASEFDSRWLEAGDFDEDGDADLLAGDSDYPSTMRTYLGNGNGTFGPQSASFDFAGWAPAVGNLEALQIGDVDGDGVLDAVAGQNNRQYTVALGDGDGSFSVMPGSPVTFPVTTPSGSFESVAIGDYDGDEDADLALGIRSFDAAGGVYVAEGAGDGTFTPVSPDPLLGGTGGAVTSIETLDLNQDAADDLSVVLRANEQDVRTLLGSPDSLIVNPDPNGTTMLLPTFLKQHSIGDFDSDGSDDIAASTSESIAVALSDGAAIAPAPESPFGLTGAPSGFPNPQSVKTGDFNGDGADDVATFSSHSGDPNQSRAVFPLINLPQLELEPLELDFGDVEVNQASELTVTVTNAGGAPAVFAGGEPSIDGADAASFSVAPEEGCETEVPAGEACGFAVTFTPAAAGAGNATLNLDLVTGDDLEVPLSGQGVGGATPVDPLDPIDPPKPPQPTPPTPGPAALKLGAKGAKAAKRGKAVTITATLRNTGESAASGVVLRAKGPKKLAILPKAVRIGEVAAGATIARKLKVKVKRTAKKGRKLTVRITASGSGIDPAQAKRTFKVK